ncbi:MAG: hypothetical protein ACI358_08020 [Candidatus Limimorpha sp.]
MRKIMLLGVFCAALLLLNACKKVNSNALFVLGNESYFKSVDEVYPKEYRDVWITENSGFDTTMMYDGFFPPDLSGKYFIDGVLTWGDEKIVQGSNTIDMDYSDPWLKYKQIYISIYNQKNSVASMDIETSTVSSSIFEKQHVDSVFISGDGRTGDFVLYFNSSSTQGDGTEYAFGNILKGTLIPADSLSAYPNGGISRIEKWYVIKNSYSLIPNIPYVKDGGQRLYIDKKPNGGFAERIVE